MKSFKKIINESKFKIKDIVRIPSYENDPILNMRDDKSHQTQRYVISDIKGKKAWVVREHDIEGFWIVLSALEKTGKRAKTVWRG